MTMCQPCKEAGKLNATTTDRPDWVAVLHKQCEFPASCTCQHRIGTWINKGQPS